MAVAHSNRIERFRASWDGTVRLGATILARRASLNAAPPTLSGAIGCGNLTTASGALAELWVLDAGFSPTRGAPCSEGRFGSTAVRADERLNGTSPATIVVTVAATVKAGIGYCTALITDTRQLSASQPRARIATTGAA